MKRPEESQELPLASFEEVSEEIEPTPPILEPLVYVVDLKGEVKIPEFMKWNRHPVFTMSLS